MAKTALKCKEMMASEIADSLNDAENLIVTSYKGLSAKELDELRKELRSISGDYLVVKNSIAKKAMSKGQNNSLTNIFKGEVGVAVDKKNDPSGISKILMKFSKDHEFLKIFGGMMEGKEITRDDVLMLASLPSREVILSKLANVLNAPMQGLAVSLKGIISKLVYVLDALKDRLPNKSEVKEEIKQEEVKAEPKEQVKETPEAKPETQDKEENKEENQGPESNIPKAD
ncbi:MAG: 50S ribosomal protein L10 [Candidatus Omnitrophota bacterium]